MSFLRRGNSCVTPDMEIRKRLEVSLKLLFLPFGDIKLCLFNATRSYAALRAADLDWIVRPGYSLGRVHSGEKP